MLIDSLLEPRCFVGKSNQFVEVRRDVPLAVGSVRHFLLHLFAVLDQLPMSVIALLCALGDPKYLGKEFLILKGQLSYSLVDLDLLVSQVVVRAVHTVVGLSIALGVHLAEKSSLHPGPAVAQPRAVISLNECDVCRSWQ